MKEGRKWCVEAMKERSDIFSLTKDRAPGDVAHSETVLDSVGRVDWSSS